MIFEIFESIRFPAFVQKIIYFKGLFPSSLVERLVPTNSLFLVIELDGFTRKIYDNYSGDIIQKLNGAWISGLHKTFKTISAHNDSEMLVVEFKPLGASQFLPLPLSKFENRIIPIEEVFSKDFFQVHAKLKSGLTVQDKISVIEEWLANVQRKKLELPQGLDKAEKMLSLDPNISISKLAVNYPYSHKKFIADFKQFIGTTPKLYQRIIRLQSILSELEKNNNIDWSNLAYSWGYADQSHFVRDFVNFTGFVPTEFTNNEYQKFGNNFFPLVKNVQD